MRPSDPFTWYLSLCLDLCRANAASMLAGCAAAERFVKTTGEVGQAQAPATAEVIPFPRYRLRR
jgi:hypothetical protein